MNEQLHDPGELKREAANNLRELAVVLDRADVNEAVVSDLERLKAELEYLTERVIDEEIQ